jgi:hypothetical protein
MLGSNLEWKTNNPDWRLKRLYALTLGKPGDFASDIPRFLSIFFLQFTNWPTFPCYVRLFSWPNGPSGPTPPLRGSSTTLRHTTSSGRTIGPSQRPPRENTQHLQETDLYKTGRIRSRNTGKRGVVDPRLRPRGNRGRVGAIGTV